ncbi:MAG: dTMP kinase [Leptolinea sp.]|jgi:dTMP kinase|nr:dTMP kinase [Leptolinea sp.]
MTGLFITLEGPDGCGKSTQVAPLADYLRSKGRTVFTTREPGGTAISDQVRQIIMAMKNTTMHPRTELLLFLSARAQLVEEVIRPRLAAGEIVISDRYADSTMAYQGYGHGYDRDLVARLLDFATGGLKPDLTLLLDIDAEEGLRRRQSGGGEWNRMDAYQLEFHRRVRAGYHELASQEAYRWITLDGSQTPEMVQLAIRQAVDSRLS